MTIKAEFIEGIKGKFFVTTWPSLTEPSSLLLILQPFAEEQNKTRHIISKLARQLQLFGWHTCVPDNFGTGDSEGDLDNTSCAIWRTDLLKLLSSFCDMGYKEISFIAIRFGSLQLFDLLNQHRLPLAIKQVVLWQPFFDLAKFWQQFLRIKIADAMLNGRKLNQKELEHQLTSGESIEIAGYPITPEFYQSVIQMNCNLPVILSDTKLNYFEITLRDNTETRATKLFDHLIPQQQVNYVQITAEPFWSTQELANVDELIAITVRQLTGGGE